MTKEEFWYKMFENMLRHQVVVLILKTSILFNTIISTADWNRLFSLHGTGGLHSAQRWNAAELELKRSCHSTSLMRVINLQFLNVKSRNKRIGLDYWHNYYHIRSAQSDCQGLTNPLDSKTLTYVHKNKNPTKKVGWKLHKCCDGMSFVFNNAHSPELSGYLKYEVRQLRICQGWYHSVVLS